MKKTIIYAVVLVVVSLVAGAVGGMAVQKYAFLKKRHAFMRQLRDRKFDMGKFRDAGRNQILKRLSEQLNLTEEQKAKVKVTLEGARDQVNAVSADVMKKVIAIREDTNTQIKAVLTPEQKVKFEKLSEELKNKFGGKRGPHKKGYGGPGLGGPEEGPGPHEGTPDLDAFN